MAINPYSSETPSSSEDESSDTSDTAEEILTTDSEFTPGPDGVKKRITMRQKEQRKLRRLLKGMPKPKRPGARIIYTTRGEVAGVGFKDFTKNQTYFDNLEALATSNPKLLAD